MAFGSGAYGSVPYGSTFKTLPTAPEITYIEFLSKDMVRVWFNEDIIVNNDYRSVSNYTIIDGNFKILPIVDVLRTTAISLPYVILRTKPQIDGQSYSITVLNLVDRSGTEISSLANTGAWVYTRTKGDSIIASMPAMYDVSPASNLRSILQAIANEDNLIAGAPSGIEED